MSFLKQGGIEIAQSLMEDSHAIAAMRSQNFDLVLRDIGSWPTHLPAEMLQIPEIDLIAISTLLPICANRWSIPNPISYIPQFTSSRTPNPVSFCKLQGTRSRQPCTDCPRQILLLPSWISCFSNGQPDLSI